MAQGQGESTSLVSLAVDATVLVGSLLPTFPDGLKTDADAMDATELLAKTSRFLKDVESKRMGQTKPITDLKKAIDADYGKITAMIRQEDGRLRRLLAEWGDEQRRIADEAAARAAEIEEPTEDAPDLPAPVKSITADGARLDFKDNWTWELEDINLVPRKYLTLDRGVVTRDVKVNQVREIPGFRIFNQPVPAVTGDFRRAEIIEGGLANGKEGQGPEEASRTEAGTVATSTEAANGPGRGIDIGNGDGPAGSEPV